MLVAVEADRLGLETDDIEDEASLLDALRWVLFRIPPSKRIKCLPAYGSWPPELQEKAAEVLSQDWITSRWLWASTALRNELKGGERLAAEGLRVLDWKDATSNSKGGVIERTLAQLNYIGPVDRDEWHRPGDCIDWNNGYLMQVAYEYPAHAPDGLFHMPVGASNGVVEVSGVQISTAALMDAFPADDRPHPYIPHATPVGEGNHLKGQATTPPADDKPTRSRTGPEPHTRLKAMAFVAAMAYTHGPDLSLPDLQPGAIARRALDLWPTIRDDDPPSHDTFVAAIKMLMETFQEMARADAGAEGS